MMKEMAERMAVTIRVMNIFKDGYENTRECLFVSELRGMETALKTLGINFEYEFNEDVTEITAVSVEGNKVII